MIIEISEEQVKDIAARAVDTFTEAIDGMGKNRAFIFANQLAIISTGFICARYGEDTHDKLLVELLRRPKEVLTQQTKH